MFSVWCATHTVYCLMRRHLWEEVLEKGDEMEPDPERLSGKFRLISFVMATLFCIHFSSMTNPNPPMEIKLTTVSQYSPARRAVSYPLPWLNPIQELCQSSMHPSLISLSKFWTVSQWDLAWLRHQLFLVFRVNLLSTTSMISCTKPHHNNMSVVFVYLWVHLWLPPRMCRNSISKNVLVPQQCIKDYLYNDYTIRTWNQQDGHRRTERSLISRIEEGSLRRTRFDINFPCFVRWSCKLDGGNFLPRMHTSNLLSV